LRKIVMNVETSEQRVAVLEHNQLVEIMHEHPGRNDIVGRIYKAKVANVLPGMQAVFVDLGIEKNGYLYRDELLSFQRSPLSQEEKKKRSVSEFVTEGEELLVQVIKEGFGNKGPVVTEDISLPGRYIVYMPFSHYVGVSKKIAAEERDRWRELGESLCKGEEGLIIRTSSSDQTNEAISLELEYLRNQWQKISDKEKQSNTPSLLYEDDGIIERVIRDYGTNSIEEIVVDSSLFFNRIKELALHYPKLHGKVTRYRDQENIFAAYGIESEIEKALRQRVWLKNGAYLIIEQTEALTVIDVNTGKYTGKQSLRDTIIKTNRSAAKEIARQLRLRDLSGIVVIDFINMVNENDLLEVQKVLTEALKRDRTKTKVLGFTSLGLFELTRKKVRENLQTVIEAQCPTCQGKGQIMSPLSVACQIERIMYEYRSRDEEALWLEASPKVSAILKGLEEESNLIIYLTEHDLEDYRKFEIRHIGSKEEIEERLNALNKSYSLI
jgi:ribonuclease G